MTGLPEQVQEKLVVFLREGKTGNVTLDIKDGRILAWKITEAGRIDYKKP